MALDKKKILVIDDDRDIHTFMRTFLVKAGYEIHFAMDALQGTTMARQVQPDAIILDISMPAGGGYTLFDRLRHLSGTAGVPILIYSAIGPAKIREKIQETGDTRILEKPASPWVILAEIQKLLHID